MWNKRDEVPPAKPLSKQPAPAEQPRLEPTRAQAIRENPMPANEPVRTQSIPQPSPSSSSSSSSAAAIGASMIIVGEIYSREELLVDGEVDGKLELQHRLTVGANGKLRATIKAREVVVYGNVQGDVEVSDKITIKKGGSLIGDIRTAGIVIDDGAYFKGSIDIVKSPPIVAAPKESHQVPA
jgi:cytoskeletal protein CcmA (bactofilin family)